MTTQIGNYDDVIDSRDVIARIEELEPFKVVRRELPYDEISSFKTRTEASEFIASEDYDPDKVMITLDKDEGEELQQLEHLAHQGEDLEDWDYGVTLVRDSYFETYAEEFANDIGAINSDASWPLNHISWEDAAAELKQDYTSVTFDGVTYWAR